MTEGLQIVGLGLATLDILVRLRQMPTWEQAGPIRAFRFDGGGLVGTAMVAAAKLGARVGYVGTAGNDAAAELKLRSFVEAGVDLSRLIRRPAPEDQVIMVYVHAETGERAFAGLENLRGAPLRLEELDRDYIAAAPYLHLDGFHPEAAMQAARWAREAGNQIVFDASLATGPIRDYRRALVPLTDILISGRDFGYHLTGKRDIFQAGEAILGMGPRVFVETVGDQGCYTVTATERFHTPAFPVSVVDTTGAGDVFHGAYIVGLLQGWDLRRVAQFASAVSALKCTVLGGRAGIPTFAQTLGFLRERGIEMG